MGPGKEHLNDGIVGGWLQLREDGEAELLVGHQKVGERQALAAHDGVGHDAVVFERVEQIDHLRRAVAAVEQAVRQKHRLNADRHPRLVRYIAQQPHVCAIQDFEIQRIGAVDGRLRGVRGDYFFASEGHAALSEPGVRACAMLAMRFSRSGFSWLRCAKPSPASFHLLPVRMMRMSAPVRSTSSAHGRASVPRSTRAVAIAVSKRATAACAHQRSAA